jgi:predicted permease
VRLTETRYSTPALRRAFFNELASRARAINGVEALTVADGAPPSRQFTIGALQVEGQPDPPAGTTSFVDVNGGEPDFFKVMGIRLVQGTTFTDTSAAAAQVVINEGFARKYWPGRSALGKRVRIVFNGKGDWRTIVGVAVNASTGGLGAEASAPMLYTPSNDHFQPVLVVRTAAAASPMADLRALVRGIDPLLPTPSVTSIADAMQKSIADPRFTMLLLTTFTTLALVLSAVGLYGVLAHAVAQRTREIGIRVALGATRRNIARAVVSQGVLLALGGIVCGMIGAKWATKLVDEMLYGVSRGDPLSFVIGGCVLLATAVVACIVPMRRAVSVDPLIAMRAE